MKKEDNKRLKLIFDELKKQGKVKYISDLARSIKYNIGNLSLMYKGRRSVSPTVKQSLIKKFNVSTEYLYNYSGDMFGKQKKLAESESLKAQIELLKKQIESKDKIIKLLEGQIKLLQK